MVDFPPILNCLEGYIDLLEVGKERSGYVSSYDAIREIFQWNA